MINEELILSKVEEIEGLPEGNLIFKNDNIYFDHLNLSWMGTDILVDYGVSLFLANKFDFFYGKIGREAKTSSKKKVKITSSEIRELFYVSIQMSIQEISEFLRAEVFEDLPDIIQVVLVSLWRRFGRLIRPEFPDLAMVSRMLIRGDIKFAIRYLKDDKKWASESEEFMLRRLKEVKILEDFIREGK
jgi:hypothetical protein